MRLRTRLVGLVVGLAAVGLGVAGVAGNVVLQRFAVSRIDAQLRAFGGRSDRERATATAADATTGTSTTATQPTIRCDRPAFNLPGQLFELYRADGTQVCAPSSTLDPGGGPQLRASDLSRVGGSPFTAPGRTGDHQYRVLVRTGPQDTIAVLAIDLADVTATWHRQELATAGLAVAVLAVLGLTAVALVRRELRPLEDVTEAADGLAVSDLSRRVAVPSEGSEVGRLATAFNTMIDRIEAAFTEQRASEERLRRFAADASHELRTPLASIHGFAELHRRFPGGDGAAQELAWQRVEEESSRMTQLVEDLLMLARHDQHPVARREAVDLAEVCREVVTSVAVTAPDRSLTIDAEAEVLLLGDEGQLRQLVRNLVANAVAHTPAGTSIGVTLRADDQRLELRVVDHGPGIAPHDRQHVFERFVRLDGSRTRSSGGTGLGLAIVQTVVETHAGAVRVEDTPGGGATFVVHLPAAGADEAPEAPEAALVDASRPSG